MKKLTSLLALLMVAALLVGCMAGCSGSDDSAATTTETKTEAPAADTAADDTAETATDDGAVDLSSVSANLTMGTGGESGTYYAFGGALANYIGQKTKIAINVVSTGGTKANIVGIDDGLYELATVQSDVATYAYNGTNGFEDGAYTASASSALSMPRPSRSSPAIPSSRALPISRARASASATWAAAPTSTPSTCWPPMT